MNTNPRSGTEPGQWRRQDLETEGAWEQQPSKGGGGGTETLSFCLDGLLTCGGWETLAGTGEGDEAPVPAHQCNGLWEYGNEEYVASVLAEITLPRDGWMDGLVILHLTLQNHHLLPSSLLHAW